MNNTLWIEFFTIAVAHLFAVASPGPDFAIVMKHAVSYGKRVAILTSLGVGTAILLHVSYALLGIGLVIKATPWLYDLLIIFASLFLIYLGSGAIRSQKQEASSASSASTQTSITTKRAFYLGFLTNGLNPKATVFFLSLFTVGVSSSTPMLVKGFYGIYLAIATAVWFCGLSLLLSRDNVQRFFRQNAHLFDRIMGWVLIGLAINILITEFLIKFL